jgi:hypothetical protein
MAWYLGKYSETITLCLPFPLAMLSTCLAYLICFDLIALIALVGVPHMHLPFVQLPLAACHFLSLKSKFSPQYPVFGRLQTTLFF